MTVSEESGGRPAMPLQSESYRIQSEASLAGVLAGLPVVADRLGGAPSDWTVQEVSDGNMNLVFSVRGAAGSVIVKQALPFIRVIGESWPFPLSRIEFEHEALRLQSRLVPERVPAVLHYDPALALIVMEELAPHIILRKGLVRGLLYPQLARHVASFLARTLFFTSDLAVSTPEKKGLMARFAGNAELCATTEDVVFTGPYGDAPLNRWTRPHLDRIVASLKQDTEVKLAATELKLTFRTATEALIHGDLHTGSIMVTETDTKIIDPEWAFYGPMGFDVGAVIGNLLLAYFSQPGHASSNDDRVTYQAWLLRTIEEIWTCFEAELLSLWRESGAMLLPPDLSLHPSAIEPMRKRRMKALLADTIGFAGAKMIRRIIGISHVEDFEAIVEPTIRARCEGTALVFAGEIMVQRNDFANIQAVTEYAKNAASLIGVDVDG